MTIEELNIRDSNFYTLREICQALSFSRTRVYCAISAGDLGAVKVGASTRVPRESLRKFLANVKPAIIARPRNA